MNIKAELESALRVKTAYRMLVKASITKSSKDRREVELFVETLEDKECREVMNLCDCFGIPTPKNLAYNYKTQKWRC